jgi:hypothetical protein
MEWGMGDIMKVAEQKEIIKMKAGTRPWDQRVDETPKAWEAFLIYREMGAGHRSIGKCAALLGKMILNVRRWRIKYDWDLRVAAYDAMLSEHMEKARIEEAKSMGVRHAKLGLGMAEIAQKRVEQIVANPEIIASLSVGDVARLAKDGTQIEREARGESKDDGSKANITFNFNMAAPPKWAPKQVVEGALKAINEAVVTGNPMPIAAAVDIPGDEDEDSGGDE